jgi:hypothetical protein
MDMEMQHGYGRAVWTRTRSMDIDTQHGLGHVSA